MITSWGRSIHTCMHNWGWTEACAPHSLKGVAGSWTHMVLTVRHTTDGPLVRRAIPMDDSVWGARIIHVFVWKNNRPGPYWLGWFITLWYSRRQCISSVGSSWTPAGSVHPTIINSVQQRASLLPVELFPMTTSYIFLLYTWMEDSGFLGFVGRRRSLSCGTVNFIYNIERKSKFPAFILRWRRAYTSEKAMNIRAENEMKIWIQSNYSFKSLLFILKNVSHQVIEFLW